MKKFSYFFIATLLAALAFVPMIWADSDSEKILMEGIEALKAKDYEKAVSLFEEAGDRGEGRAVYFLGEMYYQGDGVPQDAEKGKALMEKSGDMGYLVGYIRLGKVGEQRLRNFPISDSKGFKDLSAQVVTWYLKAAEQGDIEAQYFLAAFARKQIGIWPKPPKEEAKDEEYALSWYRKAAENGHPIASFDLAQIYDKGWVGQEVDREQAAKWYLKAAENGHIDSQFLVGRFYETGTGVPQNMEQAVFWYRKAMENGSDFARYQLRELGYLK